MPRISIPQRRILPSTQPGPKIPTGLFSDQFAAQQAGARGIGDIGQLLGGAAAISAKGQGAKEEKAAKVAADTLKAQGAEEFTAAKLDYETAFRKFQAGLQTDTDYSTYSEKFNAWHDGFTSERIKGVNHKGAAARSQTEFDLQRALRGRTIDGDAQNKLVRETRRTLPDKIDAFVSEDLGAETDQEKIKVDAERAEYFQTLIDTGVVNAAEAAALEGDYQRAKGERVLQNTVTAIAVEEGWDEALDWLNVPENVKELFDDFGIELADVDKVLEDVRTQARLSRADGITALENQREKDRQAVLDKLLSKDLSDSADFINNTSMKVEEKNTWINRFDKAADDINKGTKITTDQRVNNDLLDSANDIATGAVSRDEVLAAANEARYSEKPMIDDAAYNNIRSVIDREHTSYQGQAISEAGGFLSGQLVSITQALIDQLLISGAKIDIEQASKKRDNELWNLGQAKKALNDWFAQPANKDANSDEIYVQSRKIGVMYNRSLPSIEAARANFEDRLRRSRQSAPAVNVPAKFPNPIRVVSPDGTTGFSSEEKFKEKLEPLGFKKVTDKNADDNKTK